MKLVFFKRKILSSYQLGPNTIQEEFVCEIDGVPLEGIELYGRQIKLGNVYYLYDRDDKDGSAILTSIEVFRKTSASICHCDDTWCNLMCRI